MRFKPRLIIFIGRQISKRLMRTNVVIHIMHLEIMNFVRKKLSPLAMPQEIEFVDSLPKTRSGKIMRRILHAREWGEEIGDTSTIEND